VAPTLIAVAHGSRDPRSAATMAQLVDVVRVLAPELDVALSFLDLTDPPLVDVLERVHADGQHEAVVVPLLLGRAYHAEVDIPAAVAHVHERHPELRVQVAQVLGADPRIVRIALRRLTEGGADLADPDLGVVVTGVGSSRTAANDAVHAVAAGLALPYAAAAFATAAPTVSQAARALRRRGARALAVGSWFLAPGLLPDQVRREAARVAPGSVVAAAIGAHPDLAAVVLDRYSAAACSLVGSPQLA